MPDTTHPQTPPEPFPLSSALLSEIPAFAALTEAEVAKLLASATLRKVPPRRTFFEQGETSDTFLLLVGGYVRYSRVTQDGQQVVTCYVVPGSLFGIASALGRARYSVTATAASDCGALSWPADHWDRFCQDIPAFEAASREALGQRMELLESKIVDLSTAPVEQRIARALGRLAQQAGKPVGQGTAIDFALTRQDISELAGTTMHSVSRLLSNWEKAGIVQSKRREVVLIQPDKLQEIAA